MLVSAVTAGAVLSCGSMEAATLEALWEFSETAGSTAADSVAGEPMNIFDNANLNIAGRFGSGIEFSNDGTQAARGVINGANGIAASQQTGDFSVAVWVRPTAEDLADNFARIIDTSSNNSGITTGYRLFTGSDPTKFRFLADSGANTDLNHSRTLSGDTWTLLVVRYDTDGQATANVLLDGDIVNTAFVASNSESVSANGPVVYADGENTNIGSQDSPVLGNDFDGAMDDIAFFSGLLTDEEIATIYNSGAATFVPEPSTAGLLAVGLLGLSARRRKW
jgi:hypothetical protein